MRLVIANIQALACACLFGVKLYASSVANLLFRAQKFADVPFTS
jgi:hypothetical protein